MIKLKLLAFLIHLSCVINANNDTVSYSNHKIYIVRSRGLNAPVLKTPEEEFRVLNSRHLCNDEQNMLTVRSYLVHSSMEDAFISAIQDKRNSVLHFTVKDVEDSINQEKSQSRKRIGKKTDLEESYFSYGEIVEYLKSLPEIMNPDNDKPLAIIDSIGRSYEKRNVLMAKISSDHSAEKPILFLEAGIHAREWLAPATALYIINQLVKNYTANKDVLEGTDFYIVPLTNPDGYEYSRLKDRLWRKTRSKYLTYYGTDGNRNFDFHWGEKGVSDFPQSEVFAGPFPFSEVETRNIRDIGIKYGPRIQCFISMHAYGPYIVYPWSYDDVSQLLAPDHEFMDRVAREAALAISKVQGTNYSVGVSSKMLYPASGGADDYFKGVFGTKLTFTLEVSSAGEDSFIVPPTKIEGVAREVFEGIKVIAKYVAELKW